MSESERNLGSEMYGLCEELFPICRSITGDGVRESLEIIKRFLPDLKVFEVKSGAKCFDWDVPDEWNIKDAYIVTPDGEKICKFQDCNLHVVGYSVSVDEVIPLDELQKHLYSIPEQPLAIPYVTSYYKKTWGFCISHNERLSLKPGMYRVVIDSTLAPGFLTYGELIIHPCVDNISFYNQMSTKEIFLSTYLCHPSMANDNLSGPVVTTFLAKWLLGQKNRKYSYRIIYVPETIGSVVYLSKEGRLKKMQDRIVAGFEMTCMGDNNMLSYLPSRKGNTLSDRATLHILNWCATRAYIKHSFLERGVRRKAIL